MTTFKHFEVKQRDNYLLVGHVLANTEGHARRIYEVVTGVPHDLVKWYVVKETNTPPHVDTILPGDAHASRFKNTLYRDQDARGIFHPHAGLIDPRSTETPEPSAPAPDLYAALGLMEHVKNALRGNHVNATALGWITEAKQIVEAAATKGLKDELTAVSAADPSVEPSVEVKTAIADVEGVRDWIISLPVTNGQRRANAVLQLNFVVGVLRKSMPQPESVPQAPVENDERPVGDIIQDAIDLLGSNRVGAGVVSEAFRLLSTAKKRAAVLEQPVERSASGSDEPDVSVDALEGILLTNIGSNATLPSGVEVVGFENAVFALETLIDEREAWVKANLPATDDVVFPRKAAERIAKMLSGLSRNGMNAAEAMNVEEFIKKVFPKITRTFHVEVTGLPHELDRALQTLRNISEGKNIEASVSEDTK